MSKRVWVLGAGFSAPLGGPLLRGLLSRTSERDILVRYPQKDFPLLHGVEPDLVRRLYQYGLTDGHLAGADSSKRGEVMWTNAEDFIDYIDTAAEVRPSGSVNPHAERLAGIARDTFGRNIAPLTLRATARRLVAAECCAFLENADPSREHWKPFRRWALALDEDDTIVTFNYDRVLEILHAAQSEDARAGFVRPSRIHVVTPAELQSPTALNGRAPVLKLHGSVDWQRPSGSDTVNVCGERFALTCPNEELVIATPGPSKEREARSLSALWTLATDALKAASVVVFLGFRFPPGDADPLRELLGAIRDNSGTSLRVHIVLGPLGEHSHRVESLVRFVRPRSGATTDAQGGRRNLTCEVTPHPLYAQDFLTVCRPEAL